MADPALSNALLALKQQQAYRQRRLLESPQGVKVVMNGKPLTSFCSNDYLGLANHARVRAAATEAIKQFGVGSGASQLVSGYSVLHAALEEALADFLGYPKVVLFSSGYLANLGVIATFSARNSMVLEDRLNHASLIDGAKYAGARLKRFRHADPKHAETILKSQPALTNSASANLIVSDGVFSMQGTIAPLPSLLALKQKFATKLIVDDAHGIGVLGKHGRGSLEHLNIQADQVDLLIGTFGKAFGGSGAFVAGDKQHIEYLIQKSRTLIYTSAAPAALAAAARQSLKLIITEPERRRRLHANIACLREKLLASNLNLQASETAIQTVLIGSNEKALRFSQALEERGLLVIAIRPPTVPANTARLRITLCSQHSRQDIDHLASALQEIAALEKH